ncbi:MAG: cysteine--tRNA ligase [Bdellovibrionales bacterium]|nr:cysteine--tRNA ligase [Bdellovibrionales bacterium]
MSLKVYNTLSRTKEDFKTLEPNTVKMYCCGPTVYDFLHVGNFRGAVFYNFVRNWLESLGYTVTFVYNFTDVDDKIINRAVAEKTTASAVAEKYIEEFKKDFAALHLKPHEHNPRVTQHIDSIIRLIEKIIDNHKAYVVDGEVFYSISSFSEYGKLSNRNVDDMLSGARVEVDPKKKNPMDFTLWKPAKPGEQSWPSPWGEGRPGWHIECSCMIKDILGEQIDIHGGGMDLIFPHHENEIAQGEGASGKQYAQYWLHNNMFTFSGAKMSKSLGNIRTMRSFLEEYNGEIFKYLVMSVHYRSEAEFSEQTISNAISGLTRVYTALRTAETYKVEPQLNLPGVPEFKKAIDEAQLRIKESLNDDFNTSKAFAEVFEIVRLYNSKFKVGAKITAELKTVSTLFLEFVKSYGKTMALFQENPTDFLKQIDKMLIRQKNLDVKKIEELVERRTQARKDKNFQLSDQIRAELTAMGIEVRDAANETLWEVIK